ncbi:hypothetical protein KKF60_02010 [Patescibacteria group bacterium]|nr:hypothetical protein [Patescibacteria group bacterium]MBU4458647.1 hypothetical protein [Patescibacteria group bacterium]MCG2696006.1 hypothetical protein [Candidatus Portnoybacteria bacterium]
MRKDRYSAIKLRKQNKSYNQISQKLGIPKSTLVYWFGDKNWSKNIKNKLNTRNILLFKTRLKLINKTRIEKWEKWRESFRIEARKEFKKLFRDPLFISGINLYWGEGDSVLKNGKVRLSNTDYRLIKVFTKFLVNIIGVPKEKIKCTLILYPDLKEKKCKLFWRNIIKIPLSQFYKTQFIKGKHPTKRLENGICMIQVLSRGIKEKIMVWTDLLYKNV